MFLFVIFGNFLAKMFKYSTNLIEQVLVGLAFTNTITTWLSLILPLNIYVLGFLILICSILFYFIRKNLKIGILIKAKKSILIYSLPFIIIAFLISLNEPDNYDTGLYHLQAIKWIEKYPVVPGLANLHGRFGFNPNIFTLIAPLSLVEFFKQEIFSINYVVFTLLVLYFINKIYNLIKQQGFSNLIVFHSLVFIAILQLRNLLSSPAPDFLSISLTLFIFVRLLDISTQKETLEFRNYIPIFILSIYILTVKLATAPVLLLLLFIVFRFKPKFRQIIWVIPLLIIIVLPWLFRNVALSGWLIYPLPSVDLFSFDWKVPINLVIKEQESILGWARSPGDDYVRAAQMGFTDWMTIWWHKAGLIIKFALVLIVVSPFVVLYAQLVKKVQVNFMINVIIFTSFAGVLFWLLMAPDVRFGEPFIVVASLSLLLIIKFQWKPKINSNLSIPIILLGILGYFILGSYKIANKNLYDIYYSDRLIVPKKIVIPPTVNFQSYTINGCNIFVPITDDRCYDHEIPCTPYPDYSLILRGKTLKSGFMHKPVN